MDLQAIRLMYVILGRFLQKKGYTSYAPQYEGHAAPPEGILEIVVLSFGLKMR